LREFFDGTEVPNTLYNLVSAFMRSTTSYLSEAIANDVDLYAATQNQPRRKADPAFTEETPVVVLLKSIHELIQQNIHYTAAVVPKKTPKPKITKLSRVRTARDKYRNQKSREASEFIESRLNFVSQEEFDKSIEGG
jgi:hypothetical protein